jgi:type II secretory pathway component GspD/PulD (secretin)
MLASSSLTRRLVVGLVLAGAIVPGILSAAPAPPVKPDQDASPAAKVRKALDQTVQLKLRRQSLEAALAMLADKIGVRIVLDSAATSPLDQWAKSRPFQIDIDLHDATARTALAAILASTDLSYAVVGDAIVVGRQDALTARLLGQPVSVDLDDVELAAALRGIARDAGVNVFLDPRVEKQARKKVSGHLEDVRLQAVVKLLSRSAGLKVVRVGTVLFVTTDAIADDMRRDPPLVPETDPRPIVSFDW